MEQTDNFVSYGSFYDAIEKLPTEEQKAKAALALLRLGHTGEWTEKEDYIIDIFLTMCAPNIEAAKERYAKAKEGGKKGKGRPRKAEPIVVEQMRAEGMSKQDIADELNCSVRTVERAIKDNSATKMCDKTTDRQKLNIDIDINNNIDNDKERKIDSVSLSPIKGAPEPVKGRTLNSILPALTGAGKTQEWVEVALTLKQEKDWIANGYGLLLIPSFQEQVDRELNKREEITVKQNEIARAFSETLGGGRLVMKVEKPAAERAQDRQGLIDLGGL